MQAGKKKILVFSTAYYPFIAGAEVAIKEITDRLTNEFDFDLITARMDKKLPRVEKIGSVMVYRIGFGSIFFDKIFVPVLGALRALKLTKKNNYYCYWGVMATFATGAAYIANILRQLNGQKKIPMLLTLQEGDSEDHLRYRWFGLISLSWKLALRRTDYLTGLSSFLLRRAEKNGYKGEMTLVPNGVDLKLFTEEIPSHVKEEYIKILRKNSEDIFLVTISRLTHKNATDDIISALKDLPPKISLIVIGKGSLGPKLQKQTNKLGLESRVKFVGFIPYRDLPKYLSVCDIFIRPSRSEGFGNSFIEAMAAKLPVIATPVGGIPDFIDDHETGIFCSPDNPQSIAKAVSLILSDTVLKDRIVKNAYNRVILRYSWDDVAKQMAEVFNNVTP